MGLTGVEMRSARRILIRIGEFFHTTETYLNFVSSIFIILIMILSFCEVVGRYVFNSPIPGNLEIVEQCMAAVVFLGIAYTERQGGHIRVEMLIEKLGGRKHEIVEAVNTLLGALIYAIITVSSFQFALKAYQLGDVTGYLYMPTWPSKLCVSIGSFMLTIRLFVGVIKHLAQLRRPLEKKG